MKEENPKRDFKGIWIDKEIWLDKSLSLLEKVFLAEIDSLYCEEKGGCYASNGYFAKFFGLSKKRVSFVINSLCERGLIDSVVNPKAKNKDRRILYIKNRKPPTLKTGRPYPRKRGYPLPENGDTPSPKTGIPLDNIIDNKKEKITERKVITKNDLSLAGAQKRETRQMIKNLASAKAIHTSLGPREFDKSRKRQLEALNMK